MTPDTLPIDRRFAGVGRIHKASGTTNSAVRRKINAALTSLYDEGRLDVLRAVRDGDITPMQAYDAVRRRVLHELPIGETMPLLLTAFDRWQTSATPEYSKDHLENLTTARNHFEKHDATARVADLPKVLDGLRITLGAKHPRSFNLVRAAALAFVRATLKRSHPLWLACAAVEPRKVPKKPLGTSISPADMRDRFKNPETDKVDAIAWSLVTTGMGAKEYWGRWQTQADRIHIIGTKRGGRVRDIPLTRAPSVPRLSRDRFERVFRARCQSVITPYDLRRTFVRWLELAGVPRTRRKLYMGHGARDVTDLYERAELTAYLVEDAKKLRAFLGLPEPTATTIGIAK